MDTNSSLRIFSFILQTGKFPQPLCLIRLRRTKIQIPSWNVESVMGLEIWVLDLGSFLNE